MPGTGLRCCLLPDLGHHHPHSDCTSVVRVGHCQRVLLNQQAAIRSCRHQASERPAPASRRPRRPALTPHSGGATSPSAGPDEGWAGSAARSSSGKLGLVPEQPPELTVPDARAWREWLDQHHGDSRGVWLVLAKRLTTEPTRLTYDEALEEALCYGWIDGQLQRRDENTYRLRFTPRRPRSAWSQRNVELCEKLRAEGRMHPAGLAEMERATADGRWRAAYAGQAAAEVPPDLVAALRRRPGGESHVCGSQRPEPLCNPLSRRNCAEAGEAGPSHSTAGRHAGPRRNDLPAKGQTHR